MKKKKQEVTVLSFLALVLLLPRPRCHRRRYQNNRHRSLQNDERASSVYHDTAWGMILSMTVLLHTTPATRTHWNKTEMRDSNSYSKSATYRFNVKITS